MSQPLDYSSPRGVATLAALLLLILVSAMLAGFMAVVIADTRLRAVDRSRTQSLYAAHAGLEKLTADLGDLFSADYSPEAADLITLQGNPPPIPNVQFTATDGLGYTIGFTPGPDGNPLILPPRHIESGPFQGLMGLITPYTLTVTARLLDGAESRLSRTVNTVGIPVFQFGIFSETDLSFFPGPDFNFGGRVHTNGNLFLASGSSLTLADRVTAVGEVVREQLSNTWDTDNGYNGTIRAITAPNLYRNLEKNEGSVVQSIGSGENEPTWTNISIGTYSGNIRNGRTGARRLDLPAITIGGNPRDLIRRPVVGEAGLLTRQRLFAQASVRILLSDTAQAITNLPGVSPGAVDVSSRATALAGGYVGFIPLALSSGLNGEGYRSPVNTPLVGGFLKVEYRNAGGIWTDVTAEVLNLGFTKRNIDSNPAICGADLSPNAIIRFQRVREVPVFGAPCGVIGGVPSAIDFDYWPLALYDTREGTYRDNNPIANSTIYLGGVMHYVELDVNNLRRWLAGEIGVSGANAVNEDGYLLYFSDRRTNVDGAGNATGDHFEDFVNRNDGNGNPDNGLEQGEDVNSDDTLQTSGGNPVVPPGGTAPLNNAARPTTALLAQPDVARVNRPVLFRRALKVVNGGFGNLPVDGFSIGSENPVYVEGHYNANAAGFGEPNSPAAIMADAVTLLSQRWSQAVEVVQPGPDPWWHGDTRSFQFPNDPAQRRAQDTWYRVAILAGKGMSFPHIVNTPQDFGTDGGVHNFLRYLESWAGQTLNYRGSIASFYFNRQAVGTYKCCRNVYSPPVRVYSFDTEFLDPALLPPKTPMFRDVNSTGFVLVTRPPS